jgi:outer membrane protein, multidrug efflux system
MGKGETVGKVGSRVQGIAAALAFVSLAGCAVFDDGIREIPQQPLPPAFRVTPTDSNLVPPKSEWWKEFHSAELDRVVALGLENNHDLRVAVARIAQADAQSIAAGAARYPTIDMTQKMTASAPLGGLATANDANAWNGQRLPQAGLRTSYEADLWGKAAYTAESAQALAQASIHFRETAGITLAADLTRAYIDFLAESDRVTVAENNMVDSLKMLEAVTTRMERGDATLHEVLQQETAVATAEAAIAVHLLNREKSFNRLATLTGTTSAELVLEGESLDGLVQPKIAAGLPANLLCRRPDIRRAEANLLAANADIKVARAKMYPTLSLSVEGGVAAYSYAALTNLPNSRFYSLIYDLTQSIFDAGKNAAGVLQQEARYQEMVETYRQAILDSVRDVEDAMSEIRHFTQQQSSLARAAATARRAYDVTTISFNRGGADYLNLLEAERSLNTSEDSEVSSRADRYKAAVDLFKALGGGFDTPNCE